MSSFRRLTMLNKAVRAYNETRKGSKEKNSSNDNIKYEKAELCVHMVDYPQLIIMRIRCDLH
jgi:hypothetical protein